MTVDGPRAPGARRRAVLAGLGGAAVAGTAAVLALIPRHPALPAEVTLATGPRGAVFLPFGEDLARAYAAAHPGSSVRTLVTGASLDNLRLLSAGRADLGLVSLDAAAASSVVGPAGARAISRVYDSVLHLVVPAGSPIRSLTDLGGRAVGLGAADSGTVFTASRLLDAAGVRPARRLLLPQLEAMEALARGTLDAAFSLTGFPTPAVAAAAARRPLRLVPLNAWVDALDRRHPHVYRLTTVPQGTYTGVGAVDTLGVPNLLMARAGLADDVVTAVTDTLLSPASRGFWTHPESRRLDVRTAVGTGPVDLHPASVAWLRAHKP